MIQIQHKLPRSFYLACSGGVDSMAAYDFLSRSHNVVPVFIDHCTYTGRFAGEFLRKKQLPNFQYYTITNEYKSPEQSQEEYWRIERYKIFHALPGPVVTCHHLDDCVETWLWSSMHGEGKIIPYSNRNVIRPFRLSKKSDFISWAERHNVDWVEDDTNSDTKYIRNYIRHEMMPHVLKVNPGISKTIRKKILNEKS